MDQFESFILDTVTTVTPQGVLQIARKSENRSDFVDEIANRCSFNKDSDQVRKIINKAIDEA